MDIWYSSQNYTLTLKHCVSHHLKIKHEDCTNGRYAWQYQGTAQYTNTRRQLSTVSTCELHYCKF